MTRKIKYKPVSKELEKIVKPSLNSSTRTSIGLDQAVGEFYFIGVDKLAPFKNQARKIFNEEDILKLSDSIKEYGVRQPLTVTRSSGGKYEVISGERRLRASKLAGLDKVPCIILKNDSNANAISLVENIHREDLHPIELGTAYKKLIDDGIFTSQENLANAISASKSTISEYIKFSKIPEEIKTEAIKNNIVSRDKLRSLVKANEENNLVEMRTLVGLAKKHQKNFSILRVLSSEGAIKVQNSGIARLSVNDRKAVKEKLQKIIEQLESE